MRLLRVQVPDFRVLKNIDISFEKDFFAQIFPIGSLVGWVEARNPTPVA
jgi:hypothetical protein